MAAYASAQETVFDDILEMIDITPPVPGAGEDTAAPSVQEPSGLVLNIHRVRNDEGVVIVLVYDDAHAFARGDYTRAAGFAEVKAASGTVRAEFPYLTGGPYAVFVFQDKNADSNFAMRGRYPQEGYGHSNSRGAFEAPPFDVAAVQPGTIEIRMHYIPPRSDWERLKEQMRR